MCLGENTKVIVHWPFDKEISVAVKNDYNQSFQQSPGMRCDYIAKTLPFELKGTEEAG